MSSNAKPTVLHNSPLEKLSATECLSLFLYTAETYKRVVKDLPIDWSRDHYERKMDEEYAAIHTRAFLLRKYTTIKDSVSLKAVVKHANELLPEKKKELDTIYENYSNAHDKQIRQSLEDGTELDLRQTFDDLIYGTFLHADFERLKRLTKSSEQVQFYCLRNFVQLIEECVFELYNFLTANGVEPFLRKNTYQKAPVAAVLKADSVGRKEISGYWSNLYGKDLEKGETPEGFFKNKTSEDIQILKCAMAFLSKLEDEKVTPEDMQGIILQQTASDWGDFAEAKKFFDSLNDYGVATTVSFNIHKDTARVKILENVGNGFVVEEEQLIAAYVITLTKDKHLNQWRVFAFGRAIDPYLYRP